ncbi:MAG: C_GCAxxG_C_C family protein [Deltaproteobacteria bacterium]|nr:C_GCAxxG_C_C family protein [Deltaproteobacteria bacterium]
MTENRWEPDETARHIGLRAEHLFATKQLWCSAAVLVTLNTTLNGGMPTELAVQLSSGYGHGLAGQGCMCGSLSGAVLALGLFLGDGRFGPMANKKLLAATRKLNRRFNEVFGSSCCRVLTGEVEKGSKKNYGLCPRYTGLSAQWAAEIILQQRPDLIQQVDWDFLGRRENPLAAQVKTLFNQLRTP